MGIFRADLHIHSRYSRATSKKLTVPHLAAWSLVKGISVVATGDITHPLWRKELQDALVYDEHSGLYKLKKWDKTFFNTQIPELDLPGTSPEPLFILQGEISSIYKKNGAVRKVHNIVCMPNFESTERLARKLEIIGNLHSDGRPILGLDSRNLLEIVLEVDERAVLIPAHIWTPWFSVFGSKSGFNSLNECFEDLTSHIFALETGLSSDPDMNRLWSHLDHCALISNSDAHSGENLGREANLFTGLPSYYGIFDALRRSASGTAIDTDSVRYVGTVEFFPDEGKYYLDGHRACGVVLEPRDSLRLGNICPHCSRPLTIGVLHRVLELADRTEPKRPKGAPPFYPFIPLTEILGELLCVGSKSKKVLENYYSLIQKFGAELDILHVVPEGDLRQHWDLLGEAIARMRCGQVIREGGYDGEYGVIRVFDEAERVLLRAKSGRSFGISNTSNKKKYDKKPEQVYTVMPLFESTGFMPMRQEKSVAQNALVTNQCIQQNFLGSTNKDIPTSLKLLYTVSQQQAIRAGPHPILVFAGPGSGKTHTLIGRLSYLLSQKINPQDILVVTFSRRAAEELKSRVQHSLDVHFPYVDTLHALALAHWPKFTFKEQPQILSEEAAQMVFIKANENLDHQKLRTAWNMLMLAREKQVPAEALPEQAYIPMLECYRQYKDIHNMADYSDLLEQWLYALQAGNIKHQWKAVLVDEIQDLSSLQVALIKQLVPSSGSGFFGIGDPDQAIYSFRGAHPDVASLFTKNWSHLEIIGIAEGHRAAAEITSSATAVLGSAMKSKSLISTRQKKALLRLFSAPDHRREASWIANNIARLIGATSHTFMDAAVQSDAHCLAGTCSPGDIAILVRVKSIIQPIQESLERFCIPCVVPEEEPFWKEHRVALLLGLAGRKLGKPFGVQTVPDPSSIASHVWNGGPSVLLSWLEPVPPFDALFRETKEFKALVQAYSIHGSWGSLLEWLCLRQEFDLIKHQAEHVQIMTIHASKGLEFKAVFLPGLEEGLVPFISMKHLLSGAQDKHMNTSNLISEERRLFYVGITRASEAVFVSYAKQRMFYGKTLRLEPSSFLSSLTGMFQRSQLVQQTQKSIYQCSLFDK